MHQAGLGMFATFVLVLSACGGPTTLRPHPAATPALHCCMAEPATARQASVVRTAATLVGARSIEVNGRPMADDCAGVVRAIYLAHGIDLYESAGTDRHANGVRLIYNHVRQQGRVHRGPVVQPGDLVFFDNTWDHNGDGLVNDPLTHVGLVERVEEDGTVVFISRVAEAVERYRMNLAHPTVHRADDGRILNDHMRRKRGTDAEGTGYLTGELFAAFGTRVAP